MGSRNVRAVKDGVTRLARWSGLVPYRPERWTEQDWARAYTSGQLDYFADLDELARYSILAGYARVFGSGSRILDVGCGSGLLRQSLGDVAFTSYLGVDLSADAVEQARHRADDRTDFRVGDVMALDLPVADIVVLNEVLYFAPDPGAMLDRIRSLLADGGILVTSIWRHPADRVLWRLIDARFERLDAVLVRDEGSRLARRGWRMACYRRSACAAGEPLPGKHRERQ